MRRGGGLLVHDSSRLADILARDDTIVFVGSGVSAWSGLPTWNGLLEKLTYFLQGLSRSADLVIREAANNDLLLAASYGFDQLTPRERCEFLRDSLNVPSATPSPLHRALADLGTHCFITTNYDGLLERALRETRPDEIFDIVTPLQMLEISSIVQARAKGFIFKPHGDIGSCDSIVLTREDYRRLQGDKRNVLEALRTLLVSRPIIFVGYSLRDPDFLLVQDMLATTFGVNPSDHYALMPDVVTGEVDYWRRNYGVSLISYPTAPGATGPERHSALLELIHNIRPQQSQTLTLQTESTYILALARHALRLQSAIPAADNIMPTQIERDTRFAPKGYKHGLGIAKEARSFLRTYRDKVVLNGPPGVGKTFLIEQVVRDLARDLEQACLADEPPDLKNLRVPIMVYLRDYRGDLEAMLTQALPLDIGLDAVLEMGIGAFFVDGFNEAPIAALETNDLMQDLTRFINRASNCEIIITTRFGEELTDLGLPIVVLDEISPSYVEHELIQAGINPESIDSVTRGLLSRPLFHRAWKEGSISLSMVHTVHDVYTQLVEQFEDEARRHFDVPVAFGAVFEGIAYSMIDSGQLSMAASETHAYLRISLGGVIEARDFVNYLISAGVFLPTSNRRVAFFHHSVAEYFAAQHLAKAIGNDKALLQHCLGRRDWDQSILLTLGFLSYDDARAAFREILQVDRSMAFRALNYVEADRSQWTLMALESLAELASVDDPIVAVRYALAQLEPSEEDAPILWRMAQFDTSLGGIAAGLLWRLGDSHREWILDLLVDTGLGYNFLARMADLVKERLDPSSAEALLERVGRLSVDPEVLSRLTRGDEVDEYVGLISAVGGVLQSVPTDTLVNYAREHPSDLMEIVVCAAIDRSRDDRALEFVEHLIVARRDHAIVHLYFQLRFGRPEDVEVPAPVDGLLSALVGAIREGREGKWALGCMQLLAGAREEVRSEISIVMAEERGVMHALLAYAVGDVELFFASLERESQSSAAWWQVPAVAGVGEVDVSWSGREQLFVDLLRCKDVGLASGLLESARRGGGFGEDWNIECSISDLTWWLDWLRDASSHYVFASNLGSFLARGTDRATRTLLVQRFNSTIGDRDILDWYVLPSMAGLSLEAFDAEALEWLVGQLNAGRYDSWHMPLIGRIATEDFVQERLLPLLLEDPPDPVRQNLLLCLREAGRLHRRRYVGDSDQVLG